ncbi:MAG: hypothetical protein AAF135_03670 [Bacteroidota bacterium]
MQQRYARFIFRSCWIFLLLGCSHMIFAGGNSRAGSRGITEECMVRIAGRIVERYTQRPLRSASVSIRSGDLTLANKPTDQEGYFEILIPAEKIEANDISINLQYMDRIFVKEKMEPVDQILLIEINGALLVDARSLNDYSLPIYMLGEEKVGDVYIQD